MTGQPLGALAALEGRRVNVALRNGERIDDSQLVAAGRSEHWGLWLFVNGADTFIPVEDVVDIWETPPGSPWLCAERPVVFPPASQRPCHGL